MFRKLQRLMAVALLLGSPFLAWEQTGIPPVEFRNVVRGSGVNFVLHNCPTPDKRMIETMVGGVAVLDYDGDGRPDIFFTNGDEKMDIVVSSLEDTAAIWQNVSPTPDHWIVLRQDWG